MNEHKMQVFEVSAVRNQVAAKLNLILRPLTGDYEVVTKDYSSHRRETEQMLFLYSVAKSIHCV